MNLQQLRFLNEIVQQGLNISDGRIARDGYGAKAL